MRDSRTGGGRRERCPAGIGEQREHGGWVRCGRRCADGCFGRLPDPRPQRRVVGKETELSAGGGSQLEREAVRCHAPRRRSVTARPSTGIPHQVGGRPLPGHAGPLRGGRRRPVGDMRPEPLQPPTITGIDQGDVVHVSIIAETDSACGRGVDRQSEGRRPRVAMVMRKLRTSSRAIATLLLALVLAACSQTGGGAAASGGGGSAPAAGSPAGGGSTAPGGGKAPGY